MKIKKLIATTAMALSMVLTITACGSGSGSSSSKNTPTLSEYTAKDGAILYETGLVNGEAGPTKTKHPRIYVFESGQVYKAELEDFGTLSGMTDEEIIAAVKEQGEGPMDYIWNIETDDTGNATKYEELWYAASSGGCTTYEMGTEPTSGAVYDSYYAGYYSDVVTLIARCKEGEVPFVLDTPDSKNVVVDKTGPEIKGLLGMEGY